MAEKLTVQQLSTLNTYLKKHPDAKREDAIKLLFDGSNTKQTEKGVKVEHNKSDKKQTITLKSGLSVDVAKGTTVETKEGKITLSKTGRYSVTGKDGKTKYYAANGKELNEKYFKQVESSTGNVMVKNSKGVTVDVNKRLQNRIARASKELKHEEDNQGWMGKLWSGTKNTFGFGDSSDKVKEQLKQEQKLLKQFNQQPQNRAKIFKQLTSLEYNTKNMQDFVEGKIQLQSEKNLDGYKEGQKIAVDVASDVVSGVASFGVYTAAVAAAPFTAGASIAVGVAAAGVVGAGVKAGLKASDTIGTDKKYDSLGSDLLMGSVNGAIAPLTAGAGGAVAKTVAVRAGVQVVKETGKQATKQVISQTTKNAAKQGFARTFKTNLAESIVQPNNYKLVGGTLTKRLGAYASEGAVDGALSGGAYSGVETAKNGGNTGEILQATALGFGMGAFMGGAMTSLAHSKGIVTGNKNATKTTDKYPQLTEIDKIARHDEINQANLSPHRFSDVSGKKAQKQVSDYLDHLLSIIPENTPEAKNVNKVKKYADFILPDGTLISRNHAGDTGIPVMNPTTGQWEIPDVENAVLFWIKDVEGKEHVLPALTPENVSKAKRIIEYMSSQTEIPRENINTVQKGFLNKIKPNPKEITQDAVETSVVKETDNTVPTPKAQGDSSLAPSGRGLGRGADDITPTPKSQGAIKDAEIVMPKKLEIVKENIISEEEFRQQMLNFGIRNNKIPFLMKNFADIDGNISQDVVNIITSDKELFYKAMAIRPDIIVVSLQAMKNADGHFLKDAINYVQKEIAEGKNFHSATVALSQIKKEMGNIDANSIKIYNDIVSKFKENKGKVIDLIIKAKSSEQSEIIDKLALLQAKPNFKDIVTTLKSITKDKKISLELINDAESLTANVDKYTHWKLTDYLKETESEFNYDDAMLAARIIKEGQIEVPKQIDLCLTYLKLTENQNIANLPVKDFELLTDTLGYSAKYKDMAMNLYKKCQNNGMSKEQYFDLLAKNKENLEYLRFDEIQDILINQSDKKLKIVKNSASEKFFSLEENITENTDKTSVAYNYAINEDNTITYLNKETMYIKKGNSILEVEYPDKTIKRFYNDGALDLSQLSNVTLEEVLDSNGKRISRTLSKPSKRNPGVIVTLKEIYDNTGNVAEVQEIGKLTYHGSKKQGLKVQRRYTSPSGVDSTHTIVQGPKGTYSKFEANGVGITRKFKKFANNETVTRVNGETYTSKFSENKIEITRKTQDGRIETAVLDSDLLDFDLLDLYKQLPGDYLFKLKEYGIKVKLGYEANNAAFSPVAKTILISEERKNNPFTFAHEFGHAMDFVAFNNLSANKELREVFEKELYKFNSERTTTERNIIGYFINKTIDANSELQELIAEVNAITSGLLHDSDVHLQRAKILQENFPETTAYIINKFKTMDVESGIEKNLKQAALHFDDNVVVSDVAKVSHSAPTPKAQGVVSSAISQTEHALTASELQAIQKSIKQLPFMTEIEDKPAFYNKIIEKIQAAVTKNANGDMKLIQSRISKIDGTNFKSYIVRNAKNIDIILDNAKEINEIYDNICDEFVWTSNDVIMGINKDNFQEVLKASRLVKKGDQDAINYLYYVDYSQNPHTVKYGDTTVEVDTQDIIALLSTRQAYDSEKFDREISKLFSKNVDMQEKKAYGKSFAGIIEQKPELLEIAEKTKHMSGKEYRDYINNLFAENKLDKNLTFKTFEPDDVSVEADTAIGAYLHMRKHPELSKNVSVKETIQDTTPKPQGVKSEVIQNTESMSNAKPVMYAPTKQNIKRVFEKTRKFLTKPVDESYKMKLNGIKFDFYRCSSAEKDAVIKALHENEEFINIIKTDAISGLKDSNMNAEVRRISTSSKDPEYRILLNDNSDSDIKRVIDFRIDENEKINFYQIEKIKQIETTEKIGEASATHIYMNGDNNFTRITENTFNDSLIKEVNSNDRQLIERVKFKDSDLRRGESEITITRPDEYGNLIEDKVGTVKVFQKKDANGNHEVIHARKRIETSDGTKSRQIKVFGKDRQGTTYKILDKDGNVQLNIKRSHRKIDENHYRSFHNGERFDIKYENDGITVSMVEGTGSKEQLVKPVKLSFNELDPKLIDLYKQLPGDYLYKLHLMGVKVKYNPKPKLLGFAYEDRSYYRPDKKMIEITECSKDNPEIFAHEFSHAIDDYLSIASDPEYLKLSKQEWREFSKNSGIKERHEIGYFTQNLKPEDYNPDVELIAGVGQTIAGFSDTENRAQIGDAILFMNYSKTIAYVGKKLDMPIEEFAKTGKKVSADYDIAAVKAQHSAPTPKNTR